jgi:hypothetical protein
MMYRRPLYGCAGASLGGTGGDALTEEKKMYGAHPSLLPPARWTDEAVLGQTTLSFLLLEK